MASSTIVQDAVKLVKKTGATLGEHLIYSNNGIEKVPGRRIKQLTKAKQGFADAVGKANTEEAMADVLSRHTPMKYRTKAGKEQWANLPNESKKALIGAHYDASIKQQEALQKTYSGMTGGAKDSFSTMQTAYASQYPERNMKTNLVSSAMAGGDLATHYFLGGGAKTSAVRIGTAAAGYGAVTGAARYMSGGSMSYNSRGEKDIAGIPFV